MKRGLSLGATIRPLSLAVAITLFSLGCVSCTTSAPNTPPSPSTGENKSDADVIDEMHRSLAEFLDISNAPQVAPIKAVRPEEAAILVDKCMNDNGFPHDEFGAYSLPVEQNDQFNLTKYICTLQDPSDAKFYRPLTLDQKRIVCHYTVDVEIPCLEEQGFLINDVPSEDTFISNFDNHTWFPRVQLSYQYTSSQQSPAYEKFLDEHCPQWPPSDVLYG